MKRRHEKVAYVFKSFEIRTPALDKASVGVVGVSMCTFMSLVIVWQSLSTVDMDNRHEKPIN